MSTIAWIDLETTGLDEFDDYASILEIGVIITDENLNILTARSWLVLPPPGVIDKIDEFVWDMHVKSGLIEDLQNGVSIEWAEAQVIEYLVENCEEPPEMGGNSLGFERRWLAAHAPDLLNAFHYRNLDVSVLRSFARRWRPELTANEPKGEPAHRALSDLRNAIRLAGYYRTELFDKTD
jgi:oligoribonuclease